MLKRNRKGQFVKGMSYEMSASHKAKIGKANMGERHGNWVGDKISYKALHNYIYRHYGKATKCEHCGSDKIVQWANKTGLYKREREDWLQLCIKCHYKYDWGEVGNPNSKKYKANKVIA